MNYSKLLMLSMVGLFLHILCWDILFALDQSYADKYAVDGSTCAILDAHYAEIIEKTANCKDGIKKFGIKGGHAVWSFPWLPGYIIKFGIDRVEGVEKTLACTKEFGLDLLVLPEKRLYHLKDRPDNLSNVNYVVVEKKLELAKITEPLNRRQVQQILTFIKETGYTAFGKHNFLRLEKNTIGIIDTEMVHFRKHAIEKAKKVPFINHSTRSGFNLYHDLTQEALKFLMTELITLYASGDKNYCATAFRKIQRSLAKYDSPLQGYYQSFFKDEVTKRGLQNLL